MQATHAPTLRTGSGAEAEHRGRPRDPSREAAIREAVLELVAEEGYDRVTVEQIAARAGVGKATVYRRWESKAELVLDAITGRSPAVSLPDTGSLRSDLEGVCRSAAITGSAGRRDLGVMQGLVSAMAHDPALARVFLRRFVAPRRAALAQVFARAVERGEMAPGKDIDLLTSVIPALMMHRLVTGHQLPGRQFAARIIEGLLLPAATAAPAARPPEEPPQSHPVPPPGPQQQGDTSSASQSSRRQNLAG